MTRTTYAYWIRGRAFAELAAKSIASVRRVDPGARCMVVTDDPPEVIGEDIYAPWGGAFEDDVEIHLLGRGHRPAMVANLDAQIEVMARSTFGQRVLFMDADTLLLQPFPWTHADIHATYRTDVNGDAEMARLQPWNYGVLGLNVNHATQEALIWLRARILRMTPERQRWYGNQLALADLLGQPNGGKERRIRWALEDAGTPLSVCELACDVWNYSPTGPDEDITGKGILHMKGDRKDLIDHYAARVSRPSTWSGQFEPCIDEGCPQYPADHDCKSVVHA